MLACRGRSMSLELAPLRAVVGVDLSVIGFSVISYWLSVLSDTDLSGIEYWFVGYRLSVVGCWSVGCRISIDGTSIYRISGFRNTGYWLSIRYLPTYWSWTYRMPVTGLHIDRWSSDNISTVCFFFFTGPFWVLLCRAVLLITWLLCTKPQIRTRPPGIRTRRPQRHACLPGNINPHPERSRGLLQAWGCGTLFCFYSYCCALVCCRVVLFAYAVRYAFFFSCMCYVPASSISNPSAHHEATCAKRWRWRESEKDIITMFPFVLLYILGFWILFIMHRIIDYKALRFAGGYSPPAYVRWRK